MKIKMFFMGQFLMSSFLLIAGDSSSSSSLSEHAKDIARTDRNKRRAIVKQIHQRREQALWNFVIQHWIDDVAMREGCQTNESLRGYLGEDVQQYLRRLHQQFVVKKREATENLKLKTFNEESLGHDSKQNSDSIVDIVDQL